MAGRAANSASQRHTRTREPYMIVAIDLGTTFSGVCWSWSGDLSNVHTIRSWGNDDDSVKVPSKIQYKGGKPIAWGFETQESSTTFSWFKLLLDYENLPAEVKSSRRVKIVHDKLRNWYSNDPAEAAVKVTTDYLELLWRHAVEIIVNQEGQTWIHGMPCKVVITRPAIWSQKASARTKRAAKLAILRNKFSFESVSVTMISEPEAAAQAVLQAPSVVKRPDVTEVCPVDLFAQTLYGVNPSLKPGDIFLVCDAGGGTVASIKKDF
ncbi:hypothetical protein N0V90_003607 [Kalmusia sp. IMI 367209]|nr:hypothetical protein N0V90_003607 [Kalmusia sp. IMI 367209]